MNLKKLIALMGLLIVGGIANAVETTGAQAETATRNWVRQHRRPMATRIASGDGASRTFRNRAGRTLFHAVDLKDGGFVITAGDTEISPIVAFSDSGSFEASERNPLFVLLQRHMGVAVDSVAKTKKTPLKSAKASAPSAKAPETEWNELLESPPVSGTKSPYDTDDDMITDMRVPPLCPTQWSQQGWNGYGPAFNYYTPGNYPCGCTATAMAQVMYRWQKPTTRMSPQSFMCSVDGEAKSLATIGGTYNWSLMPVSMVSSVYASESQREAVGHLLYDVGVSIKSSYTYGGTGSFGFFIPTTLKDYFGYREGKSYLANIDYGWDVASYPDIENGVYASLDAGMPVLLSIHEPLSGSKSGHCVVLDGYGYIGSSRWTHLNSGWAGKSDAWYRFFGEALTDMAYSYLQEFVYNVHPTDAGDVISGRVLDHTGKPVAGATVNCSLGTATTDARGIYYFRVNSGGTYSLQATGSSGLKSDARYVSLSIGASCNYSSSFEDGGWVVRIPYGGFGSVGNRWGQDLVLKAPKATKLEITGADSVRAGESSQYQAVVSYSDGSRKTVTVDASWSLTKNAASSTIGNSGSAKGLLKVGETYDGGLYVTIQATYSGLEATKRVDIIHLIKERQLSSLVISGKSTLEGGQSADYKATAYFDDGSSAVVTTDSDWSLVAGSAYGMIGTKTGRLNTYETTEKGRVITIQVEYTYSGKTLTARQDVSITFTLKLRAPLSLTISGASRIAAGMTESYTATVNFNDGTSEDKTLASDWTLTSGAAYGRIIRASTRAELTAYGYTGTESRSVTIKAVYSEGGKSVNGTKSVMIEPAISISEAVDVLKDGAVVVPSIGEFKTGSTASGGNTWYGQKGTYIFDGDAAQSGFMSGSYGQNWMQTTVETAGTFKFWWNVSSEPTFDHLKFEIDGLEQARISGLSNDWQQLTFELGAGAHTLRWTYVKDEVNDFGQDAGWVDKIEWMPAAPPPPPVVEATDGTRTDAVLVSWTLPSGSARADKYELARSEDGGKTWKVLLASTLDTAYLDKTAVAGADYTYRVRAGGLAGWGEGGADSGWRKIALSVAPDAFVAAYEDTRTFSAAVTTEVDWVAACVDGSDWLTIKTGSGTGNGNLEFAVGKRDSTESRTGMVKVTAGKETAHPETVMVTVTQTGRPPKNDIGFFKPTLEWRTRLQLSPPNDGTYNPTSVFTTAEAETGDYRLSFGWTNRGEMAVSLPSVRFRCLDPDRKILLEWTEPGREDEWLSRNAGTLSANWQCDVVRVLDPGDYMIEAELDPGNSLGDVDRSDNKAVFRFAIRDPELDAWAAFEGEAFTNLALKAGSDFAQAPHLAFRSTTDEAARTMVQFGPYVPMDGVSVTGGKGALDIVFLVDVTGSMGGLIDGLKKNIQSFFESLVTGADAVTDWRAKVVSYEDYTCEGPERWYYDYGFTTDLSEFKADINKLRTGYGGDAPESLLDALCRVADESDFRKDAARVIVAFTDAPEKQPMSYGRFAGGGIPETQKTLKANDVTLWLVASTDGSTIDYSGTRSFPTLCAGVSENSKFEYSPSLSSFAGNPTKIRELAGKISKIVPSKIVEPQMSVMTRGLGTLSFKWCNDSTAGKDNTLTFRYDDGLERKVLTCEAAPGRWTEVELKLTNSTYEAGWHLFNWSYGKTNYVGAVTDCGLVSDIQWEPVGTKLKVESDTVFFTYDGLDKNTSPRTFGSTVKVICNSMWKSTTDADWVHLVHGTGDGDGELYFEVETNTAYTARSATITVRAGEYGLSTDEVVEQKIYVVQDESPVLPNGQIQILSVDVKPRWPWNKWVDIDFRIVPPAEGTEVKVYFSATNVEGSVCRNDFAYINGEGKSWCKPKAGQSSYFKGSEVEPGKTYAVCTTSGIYRVSWQMEGWNTASYCGWNTGFHSPSVIVIASCESAGKSSVALASNPVRIDLRQTDGAGGLVMSGVERIGHPDGLEDPIWIDTTKLPNGWNNLPFFDTLTPEQAGKKLTACVVNDAYVEGGTITNDTVWKADRIHVIRDNVFIANGATLTVEDGAILKFCDATRIFLYTDSSKKKSVEFSNLRMRGVYCTGGYDNYYGVDVLRAGEMNPSKAAKDKGWPGYADCLYGNGTGTSAASYAMIGASDSKAAKKIDFYCAAFNDDGTLMQNPPSGSNAAYTRCYTQGEVWGKLPKPCRAGQEFYGWFNIGSSTDSVFWEKDHLSATKYASNAARYKIVTDNVAWAYTRNTVYGIMVKAGFLGESYWPKDDADVESTIVMLIPASAMYNGMEQKPVVDRVLVSGVEIPSENYDVVWGSGNYIDAGDYEVGISFKHDYSGTPTATYTIKPCPVDSAVVKFYYDVADSEMGYKTAKEEVTSVWYKRAGVPKPKVHVYVQGSETPAPESDYVVSWRDEDWPAVGTYTAEVEFTGNYIGTARGEFTIERNPTYAVEWYDSVSKVKEMVSKLPLDGGKPRRVLYLGGRESDIPSRLIRNYIEKDADIYNFVIDNFVCWYDDCDADGTSFGTYSRGMGSVTLPLLAVISTNDWSKCVGRTCWPLTREELKTFLVKMASAPEDASSAVLTLTGGNVFTYDGNPHRPSVTVTYGGVVMPPANYDIVCSPEDCVGVGDYTLKVRFKGTYNGYPITGETASVAFRIEARPVVDGDVTLNPAGAEYNGAAQRPLVTVKDVPETEYVVSYGVGDYVGAGTYTVTVTFIGSRSGTVEREFTISRRIVTGTASVLLNAYTAAWDGKQHRPSVISVEDSATRFIEGTDYEVDFGDGGYTEPGVYTIRAVFKGNYEGSAEASFEIVKDEISDEILPPLGGGGELTDAIRKALEEFADSAIAEKITNAKLYSRFCAWAEMVGTLAAQKSPRAYESFRISEILKVPQILVGEKLVLTIGDTGGGVVQDGEFSVTVSLWDVSVGDDGVQFTLKVEDAKQAFAEMIRRSSDITKLSEGYDVITATAIETEMSSDGKSVKLSVGCPDGESGFLTLKVE